jgi:hypothetical protein
MVSAPRMSNSQRQEIAPHPNGQEQPTAFDQTEHNQHYPK